MNDSYNFVAEYLEKDARDKFVLLKSYLHGIKHESVDDCFEYFSEFDFTRLSEENKVELVRLAVYVEHAFASRFGRVPVWCFDKRLVMMPAYLGRGYREAWFFFGNQSCLNHNFFIDPGALEVM
jgi:hypothetical protein